MSELQRLVVDRLRDLDNLSQRAAAEKSKGKVSHATISKIAKGEHTGRLTDTVIEGLAEALDVSVEQVARAAKAKYRPPTEYVLPPRAKKLQPHMYEALLDHLDVLLALQERLDPPQDEREEG